MRVLVTETGFGDSDRLVDRLRAAGVDVVRCHDESGLCRALTPGGCPLDDMRRPVHVVLDVRGPGHHLTTREYGVVCAARAGLPLWIVPVEPHVPAVVPDGLRDVAPVIREDEVVAVCAGDRTATAALLGWPGRPDPSRHDT